MKHKRPPIPILVLIALIVIVGGYFLIAQLTGKNNNILSASGTIEAVSVTLSPEIGGKVAEVYADEGDSVQEGDVLIRLDDTLLQAQRAVAEATLELARAAEQTAQRTRDSAEANYTVVYDATRLEAMSTRTLDWRAMNPSGYTLPGGYFSQDEQIAAASAEVEAALSEREAAQEILNNLMADPGSADFSEAETRLAKGRAAMLTAQDVLTRANLSNNNDLRNAAQEAYDTARDELDEAQAAYDELAESEAALEIIAARADLAAAEERHQAAQDRLLVLQTGIYAPQVLAAQAVLNQATAAAEQARLAVSQAEASLAVIEVQIGKLTIKAPMDGVILTRSVEPGEVIPAGSAAMKMAQLDDLTITVFIPEDRYGELAPGQSAEVAVDSFPGLTFRASISQIADEAEFTPRNVQTVEGRSSTVYAITLQVDNLEGKLKPGMPADVTFGE